jgi:hypothetical protein
MDIGTDANYADDNIAPNVARILGEGYAIGHHTAP